ncbi:hypothetical protein GCM10027563_31650 [Parasphingorhabdus pacifica]
MRLRLPFRTGCPPGVRVQQREPQWWARIRALVDDPQKHATDMTAPAAHALGQELHLVDRQRCHHHAYKLSPTIGEVRHLIYLVTRLLQHAPHVAAG